MLKELQIENLAIIEKLDLEFGEIKTYLSKKKKLLFCA